jgi:hypothetical protein
MKHSEILKRIKEELWDGKGCPYGTDVYKTRYICILLTARPYPFKTKCYEIIAYINGLLKQSTKEGRELVQSRGIEGWLNLQGIYPKNTKDMQIYRARFIDELIRRYEEVGK